MIRIFLVSSDRTSAQPSNTLAKKKLKYTGKTKQEMEAKKARDKAAASGQAAPPAAPQQVRVNDSLSH